MRHRKWNIVKALSGHVSFLNGFLIKFQFDPNRNRVNYCTVFFSHGEVITILKALSKSYNKTYARYGITSVGGLAKRCSQFAGATISYPLFFPVFLSTTILTSRTSPKSEKKTSSSFSEVCE